MQDLGANPMTHHDATRALIAAYNRLDEQAADPTLLNAEIAEIVKERDRIGELLASLGLTPR